MVPWVQLLRMNIFLKRVTWHFARNYEVTIFYTCVRFISANQSFIFPLKHLWTSLCVSKFMYHFQILSSTWHLSCILGIDYVLNLFCFILIVAGLDSYNLVLWFSWLVSRSSLRFLCWNSSFRSFHSVFKFGISPFFLCTFFPFFLTYIHIHMYIHIHTHIFINIYLCTYIWYVHTHTYNEPISKSLKTSLWKY